MNSDKRDKAWGGLNQRLEASIKEQDWFSAGTMYYAMADFVEEEGKDSAHLKEKGYKFKLRHHKKDLERHKASEVVRFVEIMNSPGACIACKKQNKKKYSVKDELNNPTLPVKDCSDIYGCRCTYLPVID